ncbi:MAG: HEAT repeat domain-containing protein, partial [Kiritimatiellales bacterium]
MDRNLEKQKRERAVELGRSGDPAVLPELIELVGFPAASVRKLAASAIGKLAGLADAAQAVSALVPLLRDPFPQIRQYTAKAIGAYGAGAYPALSDLRDMAVSPVEPQYPEGGIDVNGYAVLNAAFIILPKTKALDSKFLLGV